MIVTQNIRLTDKYREADAALSREAPRSLGSQLGLRRIAVNLRKWLS